MSSPKVSLGIAAYGHQSPRWWVTGFDAIGNLWKDGVQYDRTFWSGGSNVDINRNNIVAQWLKESTADWLFWIDADNPPPVGALHRLLSLGRTMVSGVYYGGTIDNEMIPIAYVRNQEGAYNAIDKVKPNWEKGELLQVDAVGMGCFLTHRSVYEKILEDFSMYQRYTGGLIALKNDQIKGEIPDLPNLKHPYSQMVRKGLYYEPIVQVSHKDPKFPFFMCQFMRTEDMHFCELVRDSHEIWLDTSVEVAHVKDQPWNGQHYRFNKGLIPDPSPQEVDIV
jgi:hypothetical protein